MKVGVVGMGGMGRHHARVVRELGFVNEVVGCDVSEKARALSRDEGFDCVESIDGLLALEPDAAIVATQASRHAEAVLPLVEADVPVLSEKPLCLDVDRGRKLVELAEKRGVSYQVGFELRYCGVTRAMKDQVDSGRVGEPRHAWLVQLSGSQPPGRMTRYRVGGIFHEKLCHQIDIFRFWFGEPERLMAVTGPKVKSHYEIPDNVSSTVVFPDGRTGFITFLTTRAAHIGPDPEPARGHSYQFILTCEKGSLTFDYWTGALDVTLYNHRPDGKAELAERIDLRSRYGEPVYDLECQDGDFLRRVREGRPARVPAADALLTLEWCALAEESLLRGGEWMRVEGERA